MLPGLTALELDVHDATALTNAVRGHDAVVNLVAILHGNLNVEIQTTYTVSQPNLLLRCLLTAGRTRAAGHLTSCFLRYR